MLPFAHRGKRSALGVAIRHASQEILVLSDSDTNWEPGLLRAVLAPFADPEVGGVGTRQNAYQAKTSVWRRLADWLIDVRYLDYVRAQSRAGAVACLSGRTAAYRRSAVLPVLENLENEFFLGRRCVSGDDGRELKSALAAARPGEEIRLAPGTYAGHFTASHSGSSTAPITLCGPRSATLDGGSISSQYTLHLDHASWWRMAGFTVEGGQKGIVADGSDYDLLAGLSVHSTGDEAIHLREFSSHDTISHCVVGNTGLHTPFYGEGIYVGTAHKNWCRYTSCQPDASDDNVITDNDITGTTAENVDIKEGTTGGQLTGNHFNGTGMASSAATAWVNVKGNDWTITANTGVDSIKDGFQVHQVYPGWGVGNVFRKNHAQVNGPGHGFYVQSKRLRTIVACDNEVTGAALGLSTIACVPA